jgi:thiopeptide-type bacteriocin biosynthesis protein
MPPIELLPFAMCRTPIYPIETQLASVWQDLKDLISDSSPEFYSQIKHLEIYEPHLLDAKKKSTILKYFNRARNRATPYGKFAAVTVIPVNTNRSESLPIVLGAPVYHLFTDWSMKPREPANDLQISGVNRLQANATVCVSGSKLKYLFFNQTHFELSSVDYSGLVHNLLNLAATAQPLESMVVFLISENGLTRKHALQLLDQLVELQLLLTDMHPNIIGTDYFKRVQFTGNEPLKKYIISERPYLSGELGGKQFETLKEAILLLNLILPDIIQPELDAFREKFLKRFGQDEIPLALALDPAAGISYGNPKSGNSEDEFIDHLKASMVKEKESSSFPNGRLKQFILSALIKKEPIDLSCFDGAEVSGMRPRLPNTFSAMVQVAQKLIICQRIGGSTANSLAGRFSIIGGEFESTCRSIAAKEISANPSIEFFDVGYMGEENVDNINRRASIYDLELPIQSYAVGGSPLRLDDLFISLEGKEFVLRSKKMGKRVVPRIASAYNYSRADLSLFRFLADLQNQGIRSSISLDPEHFFPGLDYYPRVQFKNVVISPAKWLLPPLFANNAPSNNQLVNQLREWLGSIGCAHFKSGSFDQKLIFNANDDSDLDAFLVYASNKKQLYIEEHFPISPLVINEENLQFSHEIVLNFSHREALYKPITGQPEPASSQMPIAHMGGGEWLYFQIYCHYSEADSILINHIQQFIKKHRQKISCWFFVRYYDPDFHIRLRIRVITAESGYQLTGELSACLRNLIPDGIIHDLQQRIYVQEIDRYGATNMRAAESHFQADSDLILETLNKGLHPDEQYLLSIDLFEFVMTKEGYKYEEMENFLSGIYRAFAAEFKLTGSGLKSINQRFKKFNQSTQVTCGVSLCSTRKFKEAKKSFVKALGQTSSTKRKKLIADLFHMHVNRLFIQDQKIHEMVIYNFLLARLKNRHFKQASR